MQKRAHAASQLAHASAAERAHATAPYMGCVGSSTSAAGEPAAAVAAAGAGAGAAAGTGAGVGAAEGGADAAGSGAAKRAADAAAAAAAQPAKSNSGERRPPASASSSTTQSPEAVAAAAAAAAAAAGRPKVLELPANAADAAGAGGGAAPGGGASPVALIPRRRHAEDLTAAVKEINNETGEGAAGGDRSLVSSPDPHRADKDAARQGAVTAAPGSCAAAAASPEKRLMAFYHTERKLEEDYQISDESQVLGTGISGAVRVGVHKATGERFAIKTLALEGVTAKKAAMLHNEVSIYLKLDHPNIAKLVEVFEEPGVAIHLVMELCTGGELYDRLAQRKRFSEAETRYVTKQMLEAIRYCHSFNICHRDLKLENWVYKDQSTEAPLLKLIDFGFSRSFNPGIPMTAMHGTVYYVSPEVMDGCYAEKCDIWSIGVIVFMLLSGAPPFNGNDDHEILLRIKRGAYSFGGPRWTGISDSAKMFVRSLLQRDQDLRPSAERALRHDWLARGE